MRRRLLYDKRINSISSSSSLAGDLLFYDKGNKRLLIIKLSEYSVQKYPPSNYSPVGIVVVPGTHNVYGDGSCGVMSLDIMDSLHPILGASAPGNDNLLGWGLAGSDISLLSNFNQIPYVGIGSNIGDENSTIIGQTSDIGGSFPTDDSRASVIVCPHDSNAYYRRDDNIRIPSPYLTDGSRNPAYYQTSLPSSTNNVLSDFNGINNTAAIIAQRGNKDYSTWKPDKNTGEDYPAASCCNMYRAVGTRQGDWYLPACGELGYVMARYKKIDDIIYFRLVPNYWDMASLSNTSIANWWSSTEYNSDRSIAVDINSSSLCSMNKKMFGCITRAFIRVKSIDKPEYPVESNSVYEIKTEEDASADKLPQDFFSLEITGSIDPSFFTDALSNNDYITYINIQDNTSITTGEEMTMPLYNNYNLRTVIFGDDIEEVPDYTLINCQNLRYVLIGDKCTRIGGYGFVNNDDSNLLLETLIIGKNVQEIGSSNFTHVPYLTHIDFYGLTEPTFEDPATSFTDIDPSVQVHVLPAYSSDTFGPLPVVKDLLEKVEVIE